MPNWISYIFNFVPVFRKIFVYLPTTRYIFKYFHKSIFFANSFNNKYFLFYLITNISSQHFKAS